MRVIISNLMLIWVDNCLNSYAKLTWVKINSDYTIATAFKQCSYTCINHRSTYFPGNVNKIALTNEQSCAPSRSVARVRTRVCAEMPRRPLRRWVSEAGGARRRRHRWRHKMRRHVTSTSATASEERHQQPQPCDRWLDVSALALVFVVLPSIPGGRVPSE